MEIEYPSAPDGSFVFHPCRMVVWKSAQYEMPDDNKPLLCLSKNGKLLTFKESGNSRWYRHVEKYNIEYWCYQSELSAHD